MPIENLGLGIANTALDFVGGTVNSLLGQKTARENTDKTIAANKEMAAYKYQQDLAQWNRSNAYNNPSAQMQRMKAAGLNPMMAYGSGNVAGISSSPGPSYEAPTQQYQNTPLQLPQLQMGSKLAESQILRQTEANIGNTKANTLATLQKTKNDTINELLLQIQADYGRPTAQTNLDLLKTKLGIDKNTLDYAPAQSYAELANKRAQTSLTQWKEQESRGFYNTDLAAKQGVVRLQQQEMQKNLETLKRMPWETEKTRSEKDLTDNKIQSELKSQLMQDLLRSKQEIDNQLASQGLTWGDPLYFRAPMRAYEKSGLNLDSVSNMLNKLKFPPGNGKPKWQPFKSK